MASQTFSMVCLITRFPEIGEKVTPILANNNFKYEIIWCYNTQGYSKKKYSSKHDNILFYSKSNNYFFNSEIIRNKKPSENTINRFSKEIEKNGFYIGKNKQKIYELKGSLPLDWFEMSVLPAKHSERTNYSTQKPKALIERIIKASSKEGDIIADYYLGSGTTALVCKELNRNFIGCDINNEAIQITKKRLNIIK
jgi:DNA modification methylase